MRRILAAAAAAGLVACAAQRDDGRVQVRVDAATSPWEITRVVLEVQPAGIEQELAFDPYANSFTGSVLVAAGAQTVTARAWALERLVGVGSATVEVVGGTTAYVALTILDVTGPPSGVDHAPVVTSIVVPTISPAVGVPVTLSAAAVDPDGTPVTFEWRQSCRDAAFSDPASAVTQWTASAPGACTLTLVATSNGLSDTATASVYAVDANTGRVQVDGRFVTNPVVQNVSASSYWTYRSVSRWDQNVELGPFAAGEPLTVTVSFDVGTSQPGPIQATLTDGCGGTATLQSAWSGYASFVWTPPAAPGLCVLRARVEHAGLADELPVVAVFDPCSATLQCRPSTACDAGVCRQARTITGSMQTTYWDGPFPTMTLATPGYVEALVPAPGGGFSRFPATVDVDGRFVISGVPAGRYLLAVGDPGYYQEVIDTASDTVDLGRDELGRPFKDFASGPTPVTVDVAGLEPWRAGDQLQLTSMGAGLWDVPSDRWEILDGATQVLATEDWQSHLVDASLGDVLYVHQLAQREAPSLPGVPYLSAVAAQEVPATIRDLQPATVAATLAPVPQTGALAADWRTTAFEALLPDMGTAGARPSMHALFVDATPGGTSYPSPAATYGWPDLLSWTVPPGTPDFATGPLAYGQFLTGWNEFRFAGFYALSRLEAPGATPRWTSTVVGAYEPLPADPIVAPRVSPVLAPAVSGLDVASGEAVGAGTSPVLSWAPPTIGVVTRYMAVVYRLYARADGFTGSLVLGSVHTRNTSVPLPFAFQPGEWYYARIYAYVEPGASVETAPYRGSTSFALASRVTGRWTP